MHTMRLIKHRKTAIQSLRLINGHIFTKSSCAEKVRAVGGEEEDDAERAIYESDYFTKGTYKELGHLIPSLLLALRAKDEYSFNHSVRVARYSAAIASDMGKDPDTVARAYVAGLLHDIGKISIPDSILLKNGRLTDDEFSVIQNHPVESEEICRPVSVLEDILPAIRGHHERYDGNGYPDKLKGEEIPLLARIIAVADTFDAITSNRPYRRHMELSSVWPILEEGAGSQWDGKIVDVFREGFDRYRFRYGLLSRRPWGIGIEFGSGLSDGTAFAAV